jgi:hypothetical protein
MICHVSFDGYVKTDKNSHLTCPPDLSDYPFWVDFLFWINSHHLFIQQGSTTDGKKPFFPSPPFLQLFLGYPLFLYILKTPGSLLFLFSG